MLWERGRLYLPLILLWAFSAAQQESREQPKIAQPATLEFATAPDLPECAKFALLRKNPATGARVTLAKWPTGCIVPTHWHTPNVELIMVSGTMRLETEGDKMLESGGYVFLPSGHHHQFPCVKACLFYLVSDGPIDVHYVDKNGNEIPPEQALRGLRNVSPQDD